MMKDIWTREEIYHVLKPFFIEEPGSFDFSPTGFSIDSRTLAKGDIFVAVKGENFDGHNFVAESFKKGASAALVSYRPETVSFEEQTKLLLVQDVEAAFLALANYARLRMTASFIGVTGSVGKTTTKNMLAHALDQQGLTMSSAGNLNTKLGMALSLCRFLPQSKYAVLEMGMSLRGEISVLSQLAKPKVSIITAIGAAHIGNFDKLEDIAEEKAEIYAGMDEGATVILNQDTACFSLLKNKAVQRDLNVLTFGAAEGADCRLLKYELAGEKSRVEALIMGQTYSYDIALPGKHIALNSLAVLASVAAVGADVLKASQSFISLEGIAGRGKRYVLALPEGGEFLLIDESYNANPLSVKAALEGLSETAASRRRLAILGDMLELGSEAVKMHQALSFQIEKLNIDKVLTCGALMQSLNESLLNERRGFHGATYKDLKEPLLKEIKAGDVVMIKGSKSTYVSKLVDFLIHSFKGEPE